MQSEKNKVSICSIQESKMEHVSESLIRSLWGNNGCEYTFVPSEGKSGGIIVLWNGSEVVMGDSLLGAFSLKIKFRNVKDGFVWMFTSIYGAFHPADYVQFWQEIADIRTIMHEPWCLGGD